MGQNLTLPRHRSATQVVSCADARSSRPSPRLDEVPRGPACASKAGGSSPPLNLRLKSLAAATLGGPRHRSYAQVVSNFGGDGFWARTLGLCGTGHTLRW